MSVRTVMLAVVLLIAGTRAVSAQELEEPRPRQGYYAAGGLLATVQHIDDDGDGLGFWPGYTVTVRLGQLLTRRFGLGFQLDVGSGSREGESSSLIGLGLGGQVVLVGNLSLHGVIGLGVVSATRTRHDEEEVRGAYGAAYTLGLSYDWFPRARSRSGGWVVTPVLLVRALPGDPLTSYAGMFGLEVTWWTGLPKNQLDLPIESAFERE